MKKTALIKDALRDIMKSKGRFLSIIIIIALGVAFFSGLKMAPESMHFTADKYYDDYNLMDIRLVSTLGLTEEDIKEVGKLQGIEKVFGTYSMDVLAEYEEKEVVLKVHGYDEDSNINEYNLIEGRMPANSKEAVLEKGQNGGIEVEIGSTIKLFSGRDDPLSEDLKNTEYKIVGLVQTPYYLSFQKGNSNIGNGEIRSFIVIPQENFKSEVYTDVFLTVEGAREINSYKDEYFDLVDPITEDLKTLAKDREFIRYEDIIKEGKEEIAEGRAKYLEEKEKAEKELDDALKEIQDGIKEIADGEKEIQDGLKEIKDGEKEIRNEELKLNETINDGKKEIEKAELDLKDGERQYEEGLKEINLQKSMAEVAFKKAEKELLEGEAGLIKLEEQIEFMKIALENPELPEVEKQGIAVELEKLEAMLIVKREELKSGREELEIAKKELKEKLEGPEKDLNETKQLLDNSKLKLESEKKKLVDGEARARREIQDAKDKIRDAKIEIADARIKIEDAKIELEDGKKEYEEGKEKADKELGEALEEIEDGERELRKIEKGKWYVLDRTKHYSYMDYGGAADRMDALSKVFPIFFALVAALVCLTSMTRMVDEQRINIGTLKALGYGRWDIAAKYIFYASTATILGSIIGLAIGYSLFPTIIFNAYGIMYVLPEISLVFNKSLSIGITLAALILTTGTTFIASSNELRETPAILMRPKAPKIGKRILLERIPLFWNRFNFSYKVTVRNIFRYKRRFLMTVFGIAGCTALMLTAFGIRDSIRSVVDRQYGALFNYDISIGLDEEGIEYLDDNVKIKAYELLLKESGELSSNDAEKEISIIVPKDTKKIEDFIRLQDRKTEKPIPIPDDGAIITEQISKDLKLEIGDEILLKNGEKDEAKIKVAGITENYTFNFVYMSSKYYEDIFPEKVKYNEAVGIIDDTSKEFEDILSRELIENEGISNVSYNSLLKENFEETIASIIYVVLLMIISAGALAFVVLYNLTNVNISERIREIATIKVLGFYDNEVSAYIYRENTILTFIGILVGLVIGKYLHIFIMLTVEMDNIMFGLKLDPKSYLMAIGLTILFSVLVNIVMHYKLRDIAMVESLKSVD